MTEKKDIRINLDSNIWGPSGWFFCDSICLSYPNKPTKQQKQYYKNFFYSLEYVLPCMKCRIHFKEFLKRFPLNDHILSHKKYLIMWFLHAHNNVNRIKEVERKSTNAPSIPIKEIKLKDYYDYYNQKYNMNVKKDTCIDTCDINSIKPKQYNFKSISVILFGIIIALSLYILRSLQNKKL